MFRKKPLPRSKVSQGYTATPICSTIIKGGQRVEFPVNLDKVAPEDFDLEKQLNAGVELKPVSCNLLQNELSDNELQQFEQFHERSNGVSVDTTVSDNDK